MNKQITLILFFLSNLIYGQADFGFTIKGGINFPISDFSNHYNAGIGGLGGVLYNINNTTRLEFTIGYNNWTLDLEALNQSVENSGSSTIYDIEAPIKAVPILLNVKYFFTKIKTIHPYVILEGGIYKITREVYGKFFDENGNQFTYKPSTEKYNDGCLNFGAGVEYPVNEIVSLDFTFRYHLILNETVYNYGEYGYASSFSANKFISTYVGLLVFFE